ncbi:hypothetical protein FB599_3556 [Herbaspirillum sp. SJZ130]|nr:hypothetical protein FB599_3556 [Herbaspirillum sp. SJZ130]TQK08718.1 hypothetical protein FB598_3495 [Herbaspirillum sp. SJZ106]TWC71989.1 hypothetical protein FB597_101974 [Herbaspirillum sp. SJZ099]
MKKTILYAAAFAAHCAFASAPAVAAGFDCSKAGSANEKTICGDSELSALDDQLGKAFRLARMHAADRRAFTIASDQQWRWREQNCRDRACLLDWYRRRQAELQAQAGSALAGDVRLPDKAAAAAQTVRAEPLRLKLNDVQIAGIAPPGAMPWPHYVRVDSGEYFYEDPQAGAAAALVGVRYYGIENGQYIIEASRGKAVLRYTCSADCAYIGQLALPGDIEKDMVIVRNDRNSLPSVIVNDAVNGLLAPTGAR